MDKKKTKKPRKTDTDKTIEAVEKELKSWRTFTIILGVLFILSVLTNGFSLNNGATTDIETDDDVKDTATDVPVAQGITKSDKPVVELFVMSHCPFGTQAEKGIIPVAELLDDKIDFDIKYVYYAMHDKIEVDEQLKQYCIQEEQNDKFFDYLKCFLDGGDEKADECLADAKVDQDKLAACIEESDVEFGITEKYNDKASWLSGRFPLFEIHKDLNEKYGVRGSPTLVVNGQQVQSARSPAAYLATICGAFNKAPKECNENLDATNPSPGFGYNVAAPTAGGGCGG